MFSYTFDNINPRLAAPLTLAFIGDAVWEIYVRSRIINENPDMQVNKLNRMVVKFVKASGQCDAIHTIENSLTEDELSAYKRGRNAKSYTTAKNASLRDYRHATGFEALLGYVYLSENAERLNKLMESAYDAVIDTANKNASI